MPRKLRNFGSVNREELLQKLISGPSIHPEAIILPGAVVTGQVHIHKNANIWFGAVLRGDADQIVVGENSNIQDNAVIHADPGDPCIIGKNCVIGHSAIVHGAKLEDNVLIGMHATVLNNAEIGTGSIIGANALVPQGMKIPPYSLVLGVPAKVVKQLTETQVDAISKNADEYVQRAKTYREYYNSQRK
jgi:carbonic anhydrase/acetyltransferase-like protein (isoleucine patch superfamily)